MLVSFPPFALFNLLMMMLVSCNLHWLTPLDGMNDFAKLLQFSRVQSQFLFFKIASVYFFTCCNEVVFLFNASTLFLEILDVLLINVLLGHLSSMRVPLHDHMYPFAHGRTQVMCGSFCCMLVLHT